MSAGFRIGPAFRGEISAAVPARRALCVDPMVALRNE